MLSAIAQWHADKAVAAYIASDQRDYVRHIMIAKRLWAQARSRAEGV